MALGPVTNEAAEARTLIEIAVNGISAFQDTDRIHTHRDLEIT